MIQDSSDPTIEEYSNAPKIDLALHEKYWHKRYKMTANAFFDN